MDDTASADAVANELASLLEPKVLSARDGGPAIRFALRGPLPTDPGRPASSGPGLSTLVWDVCRRVACRLPGSLRIEVFAEPDEDPLVSDGAALAQALEAVLRHAVQLLGARSGRIEVRARAAGPRGAPDAPRVEVSVQGVPRATLRALENEGGAGETGFPVGGGAPEVGARYPVSPAVPPELTPAAGCPPSGPRSPRRSRGLRPPSS